MLKEALYKCFASGEPGFPDFNGVVYAIIGDCCIFSGTENERRTSTINAAEDIIRAITDREHVPVMSFRYFDLQTHRGYESTMHHRELLPGQYEFQELILKENSYGGREEGLRDIVVDGMEAQLLIIGSEEFSVVDWRLTKCPREVFELFREYIGFAM